MQRDQQLRFRLPPGATTATTAAAPAECKDSSTANSASAWHPTQATFSDAHGNVYAWSSRAHRKRRYPVVVSTSCERQGHLHPRLAAVAVAAIAAMFGGTLFEIGSWLLYWEALNQQPDIQTGKHTATSARGASSNSNSSTKQKSNGNAGQCDIEAAGQDSHLAPAGPHQQLEPGTQSKARAGLVMIPVHKAQEPQQQQPQDGQQQQQWRWFGYRRRDLGFAASFLQLIGATIFWVPCIFGTPGVFPGPESMANYRVWDGAFWLFQVVGASCFIISAIMFMLEEQTAWYLPAPLRIGWQVGFWNLLGAIGFWLSGLFGFWAVPAHRLQLWGTAMSTFWGSYAFLIGSYLQLLEAVNKHPDSIKWVARG